MTITPLHPARLRAVLETTATVHVLTFDDGEVHREVSAALSRRRHPTRHSCHVTDYFEAESALWRARPGDVVLLVGRTDALEEGLVAARDRGFGPEEIVLVPFEGDRDPVLCARCAGLGSTGAATADTTGDADGDADGAAADAERPGATGAVASIACVGCDLGMPGVA